MNSCSETTSPDPANVDDAAAADVVVVDALAGPAHDERLDDEDAAVVLFLLPGIYNNRQGHWKLMNLNGKDLFPSKLFFHSISSFCYLLGDAVFFCVT